METPCSPPINIIMQTKSTIYLASLKLYASMDMQYVDYFKCICSDIQFDAFAYRRVFGI